MLTFIDRRAAGTHAELHGAVLPKTEKGGISTNQKSLMLSGATALPGWGAYDRLKGAKKSIGVVEDFQQAASYDGRLHSLIGCSTNTSRMASQNPNLQNVPRDPRFRALVRAEDEYVILSADYNAIELRLAAVLGERTIADIQARLRGEVACSNPTVQLDFVAPFSTFRQHLRAKQEHGFDEPGLKLGGQWLFPIVSR